MSAEGPRSKISQRQQAHLVPRSWFLQQTEPRFLSEMADSRTRQEIYEHGASYNTRKQENANVHVRAHTHTQCREYVKEIEKPIEKPPKSQSWKNLNKVILDYNSKHKKKNL